MRNFLLNVLLFIGATLLLCVFLEFFIFRYILIASDLPYNYFDPKTKIIKFKPEQEGIYREKNEVRTKFKINLDGWNSSYTKYPMEKSSKTRVVIIGDSYVEALNVDNNNSMAEKLERKLGQNYEVFRFAISGAPMSQYLYMLKQEIVKYKPDIVSFVMVHNDFDESWAYKAGRYTSSFMKFKIKNNKVIDEVEPKRYESLWYDFIRMSATYRYLVYRQKVNVTQLKRKILLDDSEVKKYEANVDISNLNEKMDNNKISINYFLSEIQSLAKLYSFEPIILIDGNRFGIYKGEYKIHENSIYHLNNYLKDITTKNNIKFIDLHNIFKRDYMKNQKKFDYECDSHWNPYGHEIVAEELYKLIK